MTEFIKDLEKDYQIYGIAALGLALILFPAYIVRAVPYLLGIGLIAYAAMNAFNILRYNDLTARPGRLLKYLVVGVVVLLLRDDFLGVIGVLWAMLSLHECGEQITEFYQTRKIHPLRLVWTVISIALAFMLLHDPFEHFVFHMRILGLEVIAAALMRWRSKHA